MQSPRVQDSERLLIDLILYGSDGPALQKEAQELLPDQDEADEGTPLTWKNLFVHHDTHPLILEFALNNKYDYKWLMWDPATIRQEVLADFGSKISDLNWAEIQALIVLHSTDLFWTNWEAFAPMVMTLTNNIPDFEMLTAPTIAQCMAAMDISSHIRKEELSEEVCQFIAACAIHDGIDYLPEPLEEAAPTLAEPMYECLTCGHKAQVDITPVTCDRCTGRFDDEHPFNHKPAPEAPEGAGKNVRVYMKRDPGKTFQLWERYKDTPAVEIPMDPDVHPEEMPFYKLVEARDFMLGRRRQLEEQRKDLGL